MTNMVSAQTENAVAKQWARASIVSSVLLFSAAALHFDVTFWVLVLTNFVFMHAVWVTQLVQRRSWNAVDFRLAKWPLIAFGVLGNFAVLLWGERLSAVFPA